MTIEMRKTFLGIPISRRTIIPPGTSVNIDYPGNTSVVERLVLDAGDVDLYPKKVNVSAVSRDCVVVYDPSRWISTMTPFKEEEINGRRTRFPDYFPGVQTRFTWKKDK